MESAAEHYMHLGLAGNQVSEVMASKEKEEVPTNQPIEKSATTHTHYT